MKKVLFGLAALMAMSGCMTIRYPTAGTWIGGDTLYKVYTEQTIGLFGTTGFDAKVLKCVRGANNALACAEETQVNKLLNEGNWMATTK